MWVVGRLQVDLLVELGPVLWGPVSQYADQASNLGQGLCDLFFGQLVVVSLQLAEPALGLGLGSCRLRDPSGHEHWVGAGFEGVAVAVDLGPALGKGPLQDGDLPGPTEVLVASLGDACAERFEVVGLEQLDEPLVELRKEVSLAQVDGSGVVDLLRRRVLLGVGAPVVGLAMVPAAVQPATADLTEQSAVEGVGALGRTRLARPGRPALGGNDRLGLLEGLLRDDGLVRRLGRPDPVSLVVPAHHGLMT